MLASGLKCQKVFHGHLLWRLFKIPIPNNFLILGLYLKLEIWFWDLWTAQFEYTADYLPS